MNRSRKTASQWFAEYDENHRNPVNKLIHWICVPVIFFCVVGLIWSLPVPAFIGKALPGFKWSLPVILGAMVFYTRLSTPLALGMLLFILACYGVIHELVLHAPWPVWQICFVLFVLAWAGQFIGQRIEGKKPSFFHDVVFLLIGPAWLLHFVYRKIGLRY